MSSTWDYREVADRVENGVTDSIRGFAEARPAAQLAERAAQAAVQCCAGAQLAAQMVALCKHLTSGARELDIRVHM